MGRGGEKTVTPPPHKPLLDAASTISSSTVRPSKAVEALPTEVLRKKAVQYGIDTSADRATLLRELVSVGWWRVCCVNMCVPGG